MVTLFRKDKELTPIGAADGEDAAKQAAIMVFAGWALQIGRSEGEPYLARANLGG
jgi:hypothetical protein